MIFLVFKLLPNLSDKPLPESNLDKHQIRLEPVRSIIRAHVETLSIARSRLIRKNPYGIIHREKWDKEKSYFIDTIILSKVSWVDIEELETLIEIEINNYENTRGIIMNEPDHPLDYERFCADLLVSNGWSVRLTKGSGDQGVDIIAERFGKKAVIQCKKYSSPVGNKAVQEILGGKFIEKADIAAVISNAPFTDSAYELAESANVFLLHHNETHKL